MDGPASGVTTGDVPVEGCSPVLVSEVVVGGGVGVGEGVGVGVSFRDSGVTLNPYGL